VTHVGIIDYGLGNLASVSGAVEHLGHRATVTSLPDALAETDKLILPGVGAFGDGMHNLDRRGLIEPLTRMVRDQGKPILGICLGFQLLCRQSEEFGHHAGLCWVDGSVHRFQLDDPTLRIPHVGWNQCHWTRAGVLFAGIPQDALFYFVHSYYMQCPDDNTVSAYCDYGRRFVAALEKDNIFATQFHPEKSQIHGLTLLRNFLERA